MKLRFTVETVVTLTPGRGDLVGTAGRYTPPRWRLNLAGLLMALAGRLVGAKPVVEMHTRCDGGAR
jgi:hypothetical protein